MKQILLLWIIFGLSNCGPKPDDVHVHVHLNMSEIQKGEFGGNGKKTSPESEFDSSGNILIGGSHGDIFSGKACEEHCICNKWECSLSAARCEWHENSEQWWNPVGTCKKIIGMNKRECDREFNRNTNCRGSCNKKKVGETSNVIDCMNICKKREQCEHFIWHKWGTTQSMECMLVEKDNWGGVTDVYRNIDSNTITGTCERVSGSDCIEANIDYQGNDMSPYGPRQGIQSALECACQCYNTWGCKFFSWVESKKSCWLKEAIGGITHTSARGRTPKNGVYSGSRDCCKGFCPEKNKNYGNGHGLQIRRNVMSWEACSDLCSSRPDCEYWTWHHERAGQYSYTCKTMTMKEYERKDRNCVSGTRACRGEAPGQCEKDTYYYGDNIYPFDRQWSLSECIKSCKQKRSCKFFSYDHATRECYYKSQKPGSKGNAWGFTSGSKDCDEGMVGVGLVD